MAKRSMFVGMDVHKESIDVSLAEEGRDGEVRHYGVINGDLAVAKVVRALRAPNRRLRFVYEAGPCGFGIHRYLTAQGEECVVVNPSSMPKRSGDRIKTDRRDGDALARLHRAGELTAIYIPTADDEALRDLVRAREDAVGLSTQAREVCTVKRLYGRSPEQILARHRQIAGDDRRALGGGNVYPFSPRAAAATTAGQTRSPSPTTT